MDARSNLAQNRKSATKEDAAVNLDSPEWVSRVQVLAKAENTGRKLEASSLRVRDFETETDAWIATNIWLEGNVSNLETKLKKVRNTEFQIFKRDRVETEIMLGLVWFSSKRRNGIAEVAYAKNTPGARGASNEIEERLRIEKPASWAKAMEIVD